MYFLLDGLGLLPLELRERFLDPSGPSNTSDSWICCISLFRKFCLAVSSCRRLLGYKLPWLSLNLLRSERQPSESGTGAGGRSCRLSSPLPDSQSVCGVKVWPPDQLQSSSQSLLPPHPLPDLHLHAEGKKLREQILQELLWRPGAQRQRRPVEQKRSQWNQMHRCTLHCSTRLAEAAGNHVMSVDEKTHWEKN